MQHKSVLLQQVIEGLNIQDGDIFLDGTLGGGGHTEAVCATGKSVRIIAIDADDAALKRSKERLKNSSCDIAYYEANFRNLDKILDDMGIKKVNKILFDLGLSSNQFEESGRGFTFQKEEPLLMTFRESVDDTEFTAGDIVNTWDEENIVTLLQSYGEERFARKIAKAIVKAREEGEIDTTWKLVEIIKSATPFFYHRKKIHPATKTFQALRITVNDELGALKDGLAKGFERLANNGRMAVISFHSLEDRVVKNFYKEKASDGVAKIITKKPIVPDEQEISENPRSRSAKLRIIEKLMTN